MYSASRSRRLSIIWAIQSHQQLEKNYGREGAAIIMDNCALTISGGLAPNSESADRISEALGTRTVLSGSVSRSKNDPSQSLQMIERPHGTGRTQIHEKGPVYCDENRLQPFHRKAKAILQMRIRFDEEHPYTVPDKARGLWPMFPSRKSRMPSSPNSRRRPPKR